MPEPDTTDETLFLQAFNALCEKNTNERARQVFFTLAETSPLFSKEASMKNNTVSHKNQKAKRSKKKQATSCDTKNREGSLLGRANTNGKGNAAFGDEHIRKKTSHNVFLHPLSEDDGKSELMQEALHPHLTDDEMRAFYKAVDGSSPLKEGGRVVIPNQDPKPPTSVKDSMAQLLEGKLEFELLCRDEYFEGHIAGLDQLTVDKLRCGALSPEDHLDLHGCTAAEAYDALRSFIKSSWYKGLRTLLVIPGRGRNSLDGIAVLRNKLQLWLTQEPLKRVVLAFCTAQPQDGGPGSVYVLLRHYRKKGRIYWERLPMDTDLY
ncbi:MAG: Smr/MutS family protein [Desulfovibrio sp.]|nr:Smr/MutS family protein [Desulfovibrio sp.]